MVSAVTNVEWIEPGMLGQGRMSHAEARAQVVRAFEAVYGRKPKLREAQFAQGIALCETGYGSSWGSVCGGAGVGSYNIGGIQAGRPPCGENAFQCRDKHADGTPYDICFRSYPSPEAGFDGLIRILYKRKLSQREGVLETAATGSIREFSTALRKSRYFELGLEAHIRELTSCLKSITKALDETMPPLRKSTLRHTALVVGVGVVAYGVWRWFL